MFSSRRPSVVSTTPEISHCSSHPLRPLIVFCKECGVALCDSCLSSGNHCSHTYLRLPDVCKKQMEALMKKSKELTKIKPGNLISSMPSNRLEGIESNFHESKAKLEALFKELKGMLEANKKQAFKLLEAQEEVVKAKLKEIKENGEKVQEDMAEIREKLEGFRQTTQENPDSVSSVLKECLEQEIRIETIEKTFVNQPEDPTFDDCRMKSLEYSVCAILQKTKACLPYPWESADFITFDQNKAPEKLKVSEDKRQVFAVDSSRTHQPNRSLDTQTLSVPAEQSFTSGQHYWEVDVRGCQSWLVGVEVEEEESQQGHSRPSWMLMSDGGVLSTLHNDDEAPVSERELLFVGVFIDCEEGWLRFYNVATDSVMATFAFHCGRTMRPVFKVVPEASESSCLVLCDICQDPASMTHLREGSPDAPLPNTQ